MRDPSKDREARRAASLARRGSPEFALAGQRLIEQRAAQREAIQAERLAAMQVARDTRPNMAWVDSFQQDIDTCVAEAIRENPDTSEDDIVHDITASMLQGEYGTHPNEVNEIWRVLMGETWAERLEAIDKLQGELMYGSAETGTL